MKIDKTFPILALALSRLFAVLATAQELDVSFAPQKSSSKASLRGLSAVDSGTAWASGTGGQYLRTTNGGETWSVRIVPEADSLDFRDVEAFGSDTAYLMSAGPGERSRIYKTTDAGTTWELQFTNTLPQAFFDGLAFWDADHGIVYSDPVDGKHLLITTSDGGAHWQPVPPAALLPLQDGEYGFAASGTGMVTHGKSTVWICTGGAAARVFRSDDRGMSWRVNPTPIVSGTQSSGIFSIAFRDSEIGIAVGGDYTKPLAANGNVATTKDGGKSWQMIAEVASVGFRSCVAYVPNTAPPLVVAVGSHATSFSRDDGMTWTQIDTIGYHTLSIGAGQDSGWAAGADGRIARLVIDTTEERSNK